MKYSIDESRLRLMEVIQSYESVLTALSGGIDSALVLRAAYETLGSEKVLAVTAMSPSVPKAEAREAKRFADSLGVRHEFVETREFENPAYLANTFRRCYFCKSELYGRLAELAKARGLKTVCDGSNADDLKEIRPGLSAAKESGVRSPLAEAGLAKEMVRFLAERLGIPFWQKPSSPCLSSRLPFGREIQAEALKQIEAAEQFLKEMGFRVVRLRYFGSGARIELGKEEFPRLMNAGLRERVFEYARSLGFQTIWFEPYRSGRLMGEAAANFSTVFPLEVPSNDETVLERD